MPKLSENRDRVRKRNRERHIETETVIFTTVFCCDSMREMTSTGT